MNRAESIVLRDATCVYLEGSSEAYARCLDAFHRDAPNVVTSSPDDWFRWYSRFHRWLQANAEQQKRNFDLAEAAERSREGD